MEILKRICLTVTIGLLLLSLTSIGEPERAAPQYLLGDIKDLKDVEVANKEVQVVAPGLGMAAQAKKGETYYLMANLKDVQGTVVTDIGIQQTSFGGEIAFQIFTDEKGAMIMNLQRLNLVSPGVQTKSGDSGVIGLNLISAPYKVNYDPRRGQISSEFESNLHYALIDDIKGYIPGGGKEEDVFYSYIETMSGKLSGKLSEDLKLNEGATASFDGEISFSLDDPVLGALQNMRVVISIRDLFIALTEPAEILKVQPVFVGTGPADPGATGSVYPTLIRRSADMWNRCGTERCLTILTNDPIYINNDDYRVIEGGRDAVVRGTSEAYDLMDEVDVLDAVEVFVVDRWDPFYDGGGATWSSGTASAKIVTCDQQLDVPCPPPSGLWGCDGGFCGDVNYYHLAHELGHVLNLCHPDPAERCGTGMVRGSTGSILEPSGFCRDNPNSQSAHNCRSASSPLLFWGRSGCKGTPDISD